MSRMCEGGGVSKPSCICMFAHPRRFHPVIIFVVEKKRMNKQQILVSSIG